MPMLLVSAKKILIDIDLVGATISLGVNKMVNVDGISRFPNLTYLYPTRISKMGMAKFEMAMLGYCLVICRGGNDMNSVCL